MLRAEDLMIGDWVMDTRSNTPLRVNPFLAQLEVPEWKPIPLTPEILEKNGFEYYGKTLVLSDDFYDITMKEWSDTIFVFRYTNSEFGATPFIQVSLCFVHELQHALKLCGIEKEIEL